MSETSELSVSSEMSELSELSASYEISELSELSASYEVVEVDIPEKSKCVVDYPIPLEHSWCLWFDRYIGPGFSAEEYAQAMLEVVSFSDIQSYWRWFNHLPTAKQIDTSCTYHLMKKGIRPLWEDQANVNGGSFSFRIPLDDADEIWTQLTLNAISGQIDLILSQSFDELCGVSIGKRKTEVSIILWNSNAKTHNFQQMTDFLLEILKEFKSGLHGSESFSYKVHNTLANFGNDTKSPSKVTSTKPSKPQSRSPWKEVQTKTHHRTPKKDMRIIRPSSNVGPRRSGGSG